MYILSGDIGGTKSWLALLNRGVDGRVELHHEQCYQSGDFPNIIELLGRFLLDASAPCGPIDSAVLALPGPINSGHCQLTNLNWTVDSRELRDKLPIAHITLINDFQASAAGIDSLNSSDLVALNDASEKPRGIRVVTGAGTGLGLAWMQWQNGRYHTYATEGGHINFAPATSLQMELWRSLHSRHAHIPYESLLSGMGLETIYAFMLSRDKQTEGKAGAPIDAAAISTMATSGDVLAVAAIELFIEIYGSWTGNLALLYRPEGGLYIAGGVAAKMAEWMQSEIFINACYNKGKMSVLVKQTPIHLIINERLGLQGAMAIARGLTKS